VTVTLARLYSDLYETRNLLSEARSQIKAIQKTQDILTRAVAEPSAVTSQVDNLLRNGDLGHSFDTYYHAVTIADDTRFEAWNIYTHTAPVAAQQLLEDSVFSGVAVANSKALPDFGRSDAPVVDPDWVKASGYARIGGTKTIDFPLTNNPAFPGRTLFAIFIMARKSTNVAIPGRFFAGIWDNTAGQRDWLAASAFSVNASTIGRPAATISREYFVLGRTDFGRTVGSAPAIAANAPTDASFVSGSIYVALSWSPMAGVVSYDIYRKTAGVFHYLGSSGPSTSYFDYGVTKETVGAYPPTDDTKQIAYAAIKNADLQNLPIDGVDPAWKLFHVVLQIPSSYNMGLTTDKQWLRLGFDQALTGSDATRGCYIDLVSLSYVDGTFAFNPDDLKGARPSATGPNGSSQGGGGTGGGGDGGSGIGCPTLNTPIRCVDAMLRQFKVPARKVGATHRLVSFLRDELEISDIETLETSMQPCRRLETVRGVWFDCSESEPIICAAFDHNGRTALELKRGDTVLIYFEKERRVITDTLKSVKNIGKRKVVKIQLYGSTPMLHRTFLAGNGPGQFILHNVKPLGDAQ
jgi:hypothetical protein